MGSYALGVIKSPLTSEDSSFKPITHPPPFFVLRKDFGLFTASLSI